MKTILPLIGLIIFLFVVFGGIYLIVRFFVNKNPEGAQIATITSAGKFASSTQKIKNTEQFRFQNDSDKTQTVRAETASKIESTIEPHTISKLVSNLKVDSYYVFTLDSDKNQKLTLTIGAPTTPAPTTSTSTSNPPSSTSNSSTSNSSSSNSSSSTKTTTPPPASSTTNPSSSDTLGTSTQATTPLPNTGPGESFLLAALAVVGLVLVKISNLYWKRFIH